jgi:hypothetical protein
MGKKQSMVEVTDNCIRADMRIDVDVSIRGLMDGHPLVDRRDGSFSPFFTSFISFLQKNHNASSRMTTITGESQ